MLYSPPSLLLGSALIAIYNVRCQQMQKISLSSLVTNDPLLCHFMKISNTPFFQQFSDLGVNCATLVRMPIICHRAGLSGILYNLINFNAGFYQSFKSFSFHHFLITLNFSSHLSNCIFFFIIGQIIFLISYIIKT